MPRKSPALFLDRDGTLTLDCPYCQNARSMKLYPDVFAPLAKLSKRYLIIIITNQSGINRGYFKLKDLQGMNRKLRDSIRRKGGRIDAIYYCPHRPDENCDCRKPKPKMVMEAIRDFNIDAKKSYFIGDSESDMATVLNAGVRFINVRNKIKTRRTKYARDFDELQKLVK